MNQALLVNAFPVVLRGGLSILSEPSVDFVKTLNLPSHSRKGQSTKENARVAKTFYFQFSGLEKNRKQWKSVLISNWHFLWNVWSWIFKSWVVFEILSQYIQAFIKSKNIFQITFFDNLGTWSLHMSALSLSDKKVEIWYSNTTEFPLLSHHKSLLLQVFLYKYLCFLDITILHLILLYNLFSENDASAICIA